MIRLLKVGLLTKVLVPIIQRNIAAQPAQCPAYEYTKNIRVLQMIRKSRLVNSLILIMPIILLVQSNIAAQHPAYEYEQNASRAFENALFEKAISIAEQGLNLRPNSVIMLNISGKSYFILRKYKKSKSFFYKILGIAKLQNNPETLALAYNNIGEIYRAEKDFVRAEENYKKAIKQNKAIKHNKYNKKALGHNFYNMGKLYKDKNKHNKALEYYDNALDLTPANDFTKALIYNEIGIVYELKTDYKKAGEFYNKSIGLLQNNKYYLGIVHGNLGRLLLRQKKYDDALLDLEKALQYGKDVKDNYGIIKRLRHLIVYYVTLRDYKKAIALLRKIIEIKTEMGILDLQKEKTILAYLESAL